MTKEELLDLAKQYLILDDGLSENNLIRKIQLAEGCCDCFATARVRNCNEFGCRWRADCLSESARSALADPAETANS